MDAESKYEESEDPRERETALLREIDALRNEIRAHEEYESSYKSSVDTIHEMLWSAQHRPETVVDMVRRVTTNYERTLRAADALAIEVEKQTADAPWAWTLKKLVEDYLTARATR